MKPAPFRYVLPATIEEAVQAKGEHEDAVVLAGGQSLVPTLNFRLANPDAVIDLRRVPKLAGITVTDSQVRVGAMTRQRDLELDQAAATANPLLRETLRHVAHPVVRNRGTVGGSIAHADPAAELPCLLTALDGEVVAAGGRGERTIAAGDLFEFIMTTSLAPDEIVIEVRFPVLPPRTGWVFTEFARRHGDFALAGVAVLVTYGDNGAVSCRAAACGVGFTPVRLTELEEAVVAGMPPKDAAATTRGVVADDGATGEYKKHLLAGLAERALTLAADRGGQA